MRRFSMKAGAGSLVDRALNFPVQWSLAARSWEVFYARASSNRSSAGELSVVF